MTIFYHVPEPMLLVPTQADLYSGAKGTYRSNPADFSGTGRGAGHSDGACNERVALGVVGKVELSEFRRSHDQPRCPMFLMAE